MDETHIVLGGRVKDPRGVDFVDLKQVHVVGLFGDRASAVAAWRGASQKAIDDAEMKYIVVPLAINDNQGHE